MPKEVIFLEAKRSPKRDNAGNVVPDKHIGRFRRKIGVTEFHPGAVHYSGTLADGRTYDYWAQESDIVRGYLRWVDVVTDKFGTKIVLFVENDRALYRIAFDYNVSTLTQIANTLAGMTKHGLESYYFNVTFDVWAEKDKDGNLKTMDNGQVRYSSAVKFGDAVPLVEHSKVREYLEGKGLQWEKKFDAKANKEVYDQTNAIRYWLKCLIAVQKYMLKTQDVLPFTYNSILACENPHPIGCGNLSPDEIGLCGRIYERIKPMYPFPFRREMQDADDAFGGVPSGELHAPAQQNKMAEDFEPEEFEDRQAREASLHSPDFPTQDTRSYSEQGAPVATDDLPF